MGWDPLFYCAPFLSVMFHSPCLVCCLSCSMLVCVWGLPYSFYSRLRLTILLPSGVSHLRFPTDSRHCQSCKISMYMRQWQRLTTESTPFIASFSFNELQSLSRSSCSNRREIIRYSNVIIKIVLMLIRHLWRKSEIVGRTSYLNIWRIKGIHFTWANAIFWRKDIYFKGFKWHTRFATNGFWNLSN